MWLNSSTDVQQVFPGVAELWVAGAVEQEVESEVRGLQNVGEDEHQLEAGRIVIAHDVVAEMQQFWGRHQHQEEDNDCHEDHGETTTLLTNCLARYDAASWTDHATVSTLPLTPTLTLS